MSNDTPTRTRKPRAFDPADARIDDAGDTFPEDDAPGAGAGAQQGAGHQSAEQGTTFQPPTLTDLKSGFRWGAVFVACASALVGLAVSLWFAQIVSVAFAQQGWLGWVAVGLLALMGLAAVVIVLRELVGLSRLRAMTARRQHAEEALRQEDAKAARAVVRDLRRRLKGRRDMTWALARHRDVSSSAHDASEALTLADRELLTPLDAQARQVIAQSAKRVSLVTALSPTALIDVVFVLVENLRMLRSLATLYGGRPGLMGGLAFGRRVIGHMIATGGLALTDDLLGQFLGHDLLQRVSRRMGEGLFNGALTARIGIAGIDMVRPLPHIESTPPKFREIVKEIAFRSGASTAPDAKGAGTPRRKI